MKMKKAALEVNKMPAIREVATKHEVNFDDVIRMKFLEQSAKYLGVYVENRPAQWLDDSTVS
ncbi:MAG: hypothetical protein KAS57_08260 [Gammaproteobacteria bacterium]|nr:hypothetical protein [Gammaproteobacteria bacterium]